MTQNLNKHTDLFEAMNAAEAAFLADDLNLDLLEASDAAHKAYYQALYTKQKEWDAIPFGAAKDSGEQNAYDTEGTLDDRLFWLEIAINTYHMNNDCGYFAAPVQPVVTAIDTVSPAFAMAVAATAVHHRIAADFTTPQHVYDVAYRTYTAARSELPLNHWTDLCDLEAFGDSLKHLGRELVDHRQAA